VGTGSWKSRVILEMMKQTKLGKVVLYFNANPQDNIEFPHDWLRTCKVYSGRLLLGVLSKAYEDQRCIEHRHDDSLLLCLKQTRKILILTDEMFHPRWNHKDDRSPF